MTLTVHCIARIITPLNRSGPVNYKRTNPVYDLCIIKAITLKREDLKLVQAISFEVHNMKHELTRHRNDVVSFEQTLCWIFSDVSF